MKAFFPWRGVRGSLYRFSVFHNWGPINVWFPWIIELNSVIWCWVALDHAEPRSHVVTLSFSWLQHKLNETTKLRTHPKYILYFADQAFLFVRQKLFSFVMFSNLSFRSRVFGWVSPKSWPSAQALAPVPPAGGAISSVFVPSLCSGVLWILWLACAAIPLPLLPVSLI